MMRVTPKTEDELTGLLDDGEYDFEVLDAEDTKSKKGNEMIALQLKVFDGNGGSRLVWDYLLESVGYKVRHIADATGLIRSYEAGALMATDLEGKCGRVKIGTQAAQGGYQAKNVVKDYIKIGVEQSAPARKKLATVAADLDDEIPF